MQAQPRFCGTDSARIARRRQIYLPLGWADRRTRGEQLGRITFNFKSSLIIKKSNFVLPNHKPMTTKNKKAKSSNLNLAKPYQDITIEELQVEIRKAENCSTKKKDWSRTMATLCAFVRLCVQLASFIREKRGI